MQKKVRVNKKLGDNLVPCDITLVWLFYSQHDCQITAKKTHYEWRNSDILFEHKDSFGKRIKSINKPCTSGLSMDSEFEDILQNHYVICYPHEIEKGKAILEKSLNKKIAKMEQIINRIKKGLTTLKIR
jgi:hypothetical protein